MRARRIRPWLEPLIAELAPDATSLVVRFVSDREMRELNRTYRQQDRPTDVLTFPGEPFPGEPFPVQLFPGEADPHLGDVVISVPTARRQAAVRGHDVERELRVLVLHGVLHCLGYDHETDDGEMESLEDRLRSRWIPEGDTVDPQREAAS